MKANPKYVVLLAVEQAQARSNGKTFIQKLCYFVQRKTGAQLGFRAHYYGPYSDVVSDALAFLSGAGFLSETRHPSGIQGADGWEIVRFDYALADSGREAIAKLEASDRDNVTWVRNVLRDVLNSGVKSYVDLSFAAKTDWILQDEHAPMTPESVARAAGRFNWQVKGTDVESAAEVLSKLGLANVTA